MLTSPTQNSAKKCWPDVYPLPTGSTAAAKQPVLALHRSSRLSKPAEGSKSHPQLFGLGIARISRQLDESSRPADPRRLGTPKLGTLSADSPQPCSWQDGYK